MIVTASTTSVPYDGTGPFPAASAPVQTRAQRTAQVTVTGLIVVVPFAGLIAVIGCVATHRRHHAFTDRPGDPHSPYRYGTGLAGQLRGLLHAHVGWLFGNDPTPQQRYAPDMLACRSMQRVSRAFPALCAVSLVLPFAAGWALGGTWLTALLALVWAGLVRVFLLQHLTWSVNSLCHLLGSRPC